MDKVWIYLAVYLLGFASAMLVVWFTKKPQTELHVNKIKQKDSPGGNMDTDMTIEAKKTKTQVRKEKRELRRTERKIKKAILPQHN